MVGLNQCCMLGCVSFSNTLLVAETNKQNKKLGLDPPQILEKPTHPEGRLSRFPTAGSIYPLGERLERQAVRSDSLIRWRQKE